MPRYRFSETVIYKSGDPWTTYEAGEVYDLPADHGERWVRRQVAVEVKDDGAAALETVVVEVVTEPAKEPEPVVNPAPYVAPERTTRPYRTRGARE